MTHTEFISRFDILYNNIASNKAPGISDYEKSVFLTKAQYEVLKNYFNPKGNKYSEGVDDSIKRQIDFSSLMKVAAGTIASGTSLNIDSRSNMFSLPIDVLFILNETVKLSTNNILQVNPLGYSQYTLLMQRPLKEPLKNEAWRLINTQSTNLTLVEIITHTGDTISTYLIRYIKKPVPIILADLTAYNQTIEGASAITECELNSELHEEILQRAVELAKAAFIGEAKDIIELGQRSE